MFLIFMYWMRSNFQVNRLYTSNDTSYYKCGSAKASKRESVSFPVAVCRSKMPLLKLPIDAREEA